jgi:3-hydroxyacyl-[acyl-carrier-protein] dehydratase
MNDRKRHALDLGPDVVTRLLPHRRPFLMVDRVVAYRPDDRPTLWAERHVSANEPVFEGHFPGLHLWPGVYTIEGLGQSATLLVVLERLRAAWRDHGRDPEEVTAALRALEDAARLRPPVGPGQPALLTAALGVVARHVGLSGAVDVRLMAPVFAGQRLDYEVTLREALGDVLRMEVLASVDGAPVARGTLVTRAAQLPGAPGGIP